MSNVVSPLSGRLRSFRRIVVKIGSSLLTDTHSDLNRTWLDTFLGDIAALAQQGQEVLVVSSGAIALGRSRIRASHGSLANGTFTLNESQAAAAMGQIALSSAYDQGLAQHGLKTAQVLLTVNDTETRRQYLNAKATIGTLLEWGVIPIINENDTVATTEIRYGDNDRLAARVASMMEADLLVLLSDIDGLYTAPPAIDPEAKLLKEVAAITPEIFAMAGEAASRNSRGGMKTKIEAARIATESGTTMAIASGRYPHPLRRLDADGPATWFRPSGSLRSSRKKWIAAGLQVAGKLTIDSGALLALESGKSLLAAGVIRVEGNFDRGDTVLILGPNGHSIGRGLIEYNCDEARSILGLKSSQIVERLGTGARSAMIHRDNLILNSADG